MTGGIGGDPIATVEKPSVLESIDYQPSRRSAPQAPAEERVDIQTRRSKITLTLGHKNTPLRSFTLARSF